MAGVGVILILRRTYALSKFRHVSDVPRDFIKAHTRLRGHVTDVTRKGHLLVDHAPVISVEKFRAGKDTKGQLPVSIAGVELSDLAFPWLHQNVLNNHVWFTLLRVCKSETKETNAEPSHSDGSNLQNPSHSISEQSNNGSVDQKIKFEPSDVPNEKLTDIKSEHQDSAKGKRLGSKHDSFQSLSMESKDDVSPDSAAKILKIGTEVLGTEVGNVLAEESQDVLDCIVIYKKGFLWNSTLNQDLVRLGLATCTLIPDLSGDREVNKLTERLVVAQKKAERKGLGMWSRPSLRERITLYPAYLKYRLLSYFREKLPWKSKNKN